MGIKFFFAGIEKDDPNQLHAIMMFSNMAVLQVFGSDDELTEIRRQGGGDMTLISNNYFTNYSNAFIQHYIA